MTLSDRRRTPARPDLAAAKLRGLVEAPRYVEPRPARLREEAVSLRPEPSPEAPQDTQALYGEAIHVYDVDENGYAWVQLETDEYVGWLPANALDFAAPAPTHRLRVPRSFIYPGPSMKLPVIGALPLGGLVHVTGTQGAFSALAGFGYVFSAHLAPLSEAAPDFVKVAEAFLDAPYLWGGKTFGGIDCSGLVQVSLAAAGIASPRDTDMMVAELGRAIDIADDVAGLARGDLVFWKGHVGIMADALTLLHANAHHMQVAREPLRVARERILANGGGPIMRVRRVV